MEIIKMTKTEINTTDLAEWAGETIMDALRVGDGTNNNVEIEFSELSKNAQKELAKELCAKIYNYLLTLDI